MYLSTHVEACNRQTCIDRIQRPLQADGAYCSHRCIHSTSPVAERRAVAARCMAGAPPGRTIVVLFRHDLRMHDNPVLQAAVEEAAHDAAGAVIEVRHLA